MAEHGKWLDWGAFSLFTGDQSTVVYIDQLIFDIDQLTFFLHWSTNIDIDELILTMINWFLH